jgi:DNA-binding PadR family transcriptional regulator
MVRRRRSNPLALAVLCCLYEKPMHPYEVASTLKIRAKHESIRLNYGSLYNVVEGLVASGFIEPQETIRDGKRPERTVYAITETGVIELVDWLSDLVASPVKEYLQFEAALSLLPALPPETALDQLRQRALQLRLELVRSRATRTASHDFGLPRLFDLEGEYLEAVTTAELDFVERLVKDIENGDLEGIDEWRTWFGPDGSMIPSAVEASARRFGSP